MSRKSPTASLTHRSPNGLGRKTQALARNGLGEPAAGNVERWKEPLQKSGSVEISEDRVGFLTGSGGPGRTSFKVDPGDVVRARVTVSTSGNISARLMINPSKGRGPIYNQGVATQWVQGQNKTLQAELTIPSGMKWAGVAIDQPNWTAEQQPDSADGRTFPQSQMTGTISWKNAEITVNRPLGGSRTILGGFSTTDALIAGGALVGATVLFVSIN